MITQNRSGRRIPSGELSCFLLMRRPKSSKPANRRTPSLIGERRLRRFNARILGSGLLFLAMFSTLAASAAQSPQPKPIDLTELPIEALMNLEVPKVYAASKLEQKTTEAPSSITIITADEVKKYGYRTLADALQ